MLLHFRATPGTVIVTVDNDEYEGFEVGKWYAIDAPAIVPTPLESRLLDGVASKMDSPAESPSGPAPAEAATSA